MVVFNWVFYVPVDTGCYSSDMRLFWVYLATDVPERILLFVR